VCDIVVKKFTFAISSPDEFLYLFYHSVWINLLIYLILLVGCQEGHLAGKYACHLLFLEIWIKLSSNRLTQFSVENGLQKPAWVIQSHKMPYCSVWYDIRWSTTRSVMTRREDIFDVLWDHWTMNRSKNKCWTSDVRHSYCPLTWRLWMIALDVDKSLIPLASLNPVYTSNIVEAPLSNSSAISRWLLVRDNFIFSFWLSNRDAMAYWHLTWIRHCCDYGD